MDTESNEGCVYIKAKNTEEAAKVFAALHGQWYSGNLVSILLNFFFLLMKTPNELERLSLVRLFNLV